MDILTNNQNKIIVVFREFNAAEDGKIFSNIDFNLHILL